MKGNCHKYESIKRRICVWIGAYRDLTNHGKPQLDTSFHLDRLHVFIPRATRGFVCFLDYFELLVSKGIFKKMKMCFKNMKDFFLRT